MTDFEEKCGTCRSMHEQSVDFYDIGQTTHECRALPPQMVLIGGSQILVKFPPVTPAMVPCGQWMPLPIPKEGANDTEPE